MSNWNVVENIQINNKDSFNLHPILVEVLFARGLDSQDKINDFILVDYERDISDPFLFSQMRKVVNRIGEAIKNDEKVMIFGDYDADGVTSSVILRETLTAIGIDPQVYIPDKKTEGYGLNMKAIEEFSKNGGKLIITVDCGIANEKEVEMANELGVDIIVTDHHHIPKKVPNAYATINPKMKDSGYPFKELAGVGVAFKVSHALYKEFLPEKEDQIKWYLDLVAVGTVADMVPLVGENRAIVKYGLIVLSKTKRVGLQELFKVARVLIDENNQPDTEKISFQLAPRINAAGRMDHANIAFYLLKEEDRVKAHNIALDLESKNQQRQKATKFIVDEIKNIADKSFKDKKFIFSAGENFPIGIIGLAAGRIADEFNKPTAVLTKKEDVSVGSFRSIPGINIIEAISECGDLLLKFGGHAQAAGISIQNDKLEEFYEKLNGIIEKEFEGKDITPEVHIDKEIFSEDVGFKLIEDMKKLQPFGEGNREPIFLMRNLIIQELKWVGNGEKHLKLFLRPNDDSPKIFEAIGFNLSDKFKSISIGEVIDIVFNLQQDEWNGSKKIQLKIIDLKSS